ncbi:hypothetical protein B7494_g5337 [Chlorociboria aeruginascens]|nr:hypothetical protein B7494_g5337 [Chlorociboria aeruginascens]
MPNPTDPKILETSNGLIAGFRTVFGNHPGFRPAHAKGILLSGSFTPSATAKELSTAPHFNAPTTPIWVRYSNSTGIPNIPDFDGNADPRGMAIRFILGEHKHTDIISHSIDAFPTRTGEEFIGFLKAVAESGPDAAHPTPIEQFLGANPAALAFVTAPKPAPSSYARQRYFAVNAFKLVDASGKGTFIRYRLLPDLGIDTLDEASLKDKDPDFLQQELGARLKSGPFTFKLLAQVAEEGDVTDDVTIRWPESRKLVELGSVKVEAILEDNAKEQKQIIFDPIPRVAGVEPSADPLLEIRAGVYVIGGKQRRAA